MNNDEEYSLKLDASDFASRSKVKAKPPQRRDSASSSTRTIRIVERIWTDIEPENICSPTMQSRRNWSIFFVMVIYHEIMIESQNNLRALQGHSGRSLIDPLL